MAGIVRKVNAVDDLQTMTWLLEYSMKTFCPTCCEHCLKLSNICVLVTGWVTPAKLHLLQIVLLQQRAYLLGNNTMVVKASMRLITIYTRSTLIIFLDSS